MPDRREDWLGLVREEALEPELEICDPHHHLWDRPGTRYLLDELLDDTESHRVTSTVFVECASMYRLDGPDELAPVGETEFVQGVAAMSASGQYGDIRVAAGIVGYADLSLGDAVEPVLEAHLAASSNRFRGIRHAAGWHESDDIRSSHTDPPRGLLLDDTFRRGFAKLERYGLTFDAWLYHPQLPELASLARAFPNTQIVLDHLGGPLGIGPYEGKQGEVFKDWRPLLADVAACDNVVLKLGGIQMPINGFGFHKAPRPPTSEELAETTAPWYQHGLELFGPERCMFESNFPVDKASCSYTVLWNAFKRMTADLSAGERAALFRDTARRVYRLGDDRA